MYCRFPAWVLSYLSISLLFACSSVTVEERSTVDRSVESCSQECISGNCSDGRGIFQFSDCSRYEGGFKNGLRHGQGSFAYSSGAILKGEFHQGRPTGKFSYRFPDGATFDGVVADDGLKQTDHGIQIDRATGTLKEGEVSRECEVEGMRLICSAISPSDTASRQDRSQFPGTKADIDANEVRFLILYAPNTAFLTRNGKQYSIAAGYPLLPGDLIETRQHAADIQGEGGFAIRLKPYSSLFIPENARSNRILQLRKGSVIVDYNGEGPLPFRIQSGGMNIDVKGTTFVVEAPSEGNKITVRVIEGKVSVSRDVADLEKVSAEDLAQNPELKEALSALAKPVELNPGEQVVTDAFEPEKEGLQATLEKQSDSPLEKEKASAEDLRKDSSEAALMPVVPQKTFEEARESGIKGDPDAGEVRKKLATDYQTNLESRANDLEEALKAAPDIQSAQDFQRVFKILEVVYTTDGQQRAGSVISQAGGLLFLYAPDGLFRLPIDQVRQIDYYNSDEVQLEDLNKGPDQPPGKDK